MASSEHNENRKELESTAYHEAGHAIAAIILSFDFDYVTIEADENEGILGKVQFRTGSLPTSMGNNWINVDDLVVAASGSVAGKTYSGNWNHEGSRFDYKKIIYSLTTSKKNDERGYILMGPLKPLINHIYKQIVSLETLSFSETNDVFNTLIKLKEEFLKYHEPEYSDPTYHYESPILSHLWEGAIKESEVLINKHWNMVEILANALLERETMSYEEVLTLLKDNGMLSRYVEDIVLDNMP